MAEKSNITVKKKKKKEKTLDAQTLLRSKKHTHLTRSQFSSHPWTKKYKPISRLARELKEISKHYFYFIYGGKYFFW